MPAFRDDQIILIAPGSQTTLAQLGLPESFTPARMRFPSRMFPAEKAGEWEPYKVRRKEPAAGPKKPVPAEEVEEIREMQKTLGETEEDEVVYEEDVVSEEGAVWPMREGRITNWSCFYALMTHVYNGLNAPFHTPLLLIGQPCWTPRDQEKLTQFFFEKFKIPAFALMDSATATCYAYGLQTATVVDIGFQKADITAVVDFITHDAGRTTAIPKCGGEALTQRLLELLTSKGFNRDMCEQLKKSAICETLPPGVPVPSAKDGATEEVTNPAAAASTGATASGPGARLTAGALGEAPRGPGADTEVGDEQKEDEDNEGVLDVAKIVTSGNIQDFLAKKEKEKQEKAAAKKRDTAAAAAAKPIKLPNAKREKVTFLYEDHALLDTLKNMNLSGEKMAEAQATLDEGPQRKGSITDVNMENAGAANGESLATEVYGTSPTTTRSSGPIRREIEVGVERFQAASGGILERIADALHRTISSVDEVARRSELWDSLIIVGNGAKVRGFKEALLQTIQQKYIISPSSATIFTSELPSNLSTPTGTGANTPQPQFGPTPTGPLGAAGGHGSGVNPLLLAATTAQASHLQPGPPGSHTPLSSLSHGHGHLGSAHGAHSSHGQTPSSVKIAKVPEYFPEWKDVGFDEAVFLGAQVAAKVLFVVDQGISKGFMSRNDWNEAGPGIVGDYML